MSCYDHYDDVLLPETSRAGLFLVLHNTQMCRLSPTNHGHPFTCKSKNHLPVCQPSVCLISLPTSNHWSVKLSRPNNQLQVMLCMAYVWCVQQPCYHINMRYKDTPLSMDQHGRPTLNEGMTLLIIFIY